MQLNWSSTRPRTRLNNFRVTTWPPFLDRVAMRLQGRGPRTSRRQFFNARAQKKTTLRNNVQRRMIVKIQRSIISICWWSSVHRKFSVSKITSQNHDYRECAKSIAIDFADGVRKWTRILVEACDAHGCDSFHETQQRNRWMRRLAQNSILDKQAIYEIKEKTLRVYDKSRKCKKQ